MADHPIQGLMGITMQKIKEMVDVNTIIGEPIVTADGTTIIPVSKVTFGFASGGSDWPTKDPRVEPFGGGSGAGVTLQPLGFLVVKDGNVKLLQMSTSSNTADKIVNAVPDVIEKISEAFSKNKTVKVKEEKTITE